MSRKTDKIYSVVIIDDDDMAIDELTFGLQSYPFIRIKGTAKKGSAGKKSF